MIRILVLLSLAPCVMVAQQPAVIPLKPANGTLTDPLAVGHVRELRDGRVIVAGRGGVVVADFAKGSVQPIPNVPSGMLVPLGGDSTMVEASNMGWIFLDGDKLLGMLPLSNPVVAAAPRAMTSGADINGFVLAITGGQPESDSADVTRVNRTTGEKLRVTRTWQGPCACNNRPAPTFVVNEEAVLALDGWIAVVRAHPYRVDWRMPSGDWVRGAPLPIPPMPMDKREQAAYRAHWGGLADASYQIDWPQFVEPFTSPMAIATPDGKVLVRRWPSADLLPGTRYDIVNRRGEVEGEIALPVAQDQIVGFGAKSIYLMLADSLSPRTARLERHPWP